jgi:hypothetical protein
MWLKRIENLKRLTGRIEFGCKFDKNGRCNGKKTIYNLEKQCCCADCAVKMGYLQIIHEKDALYYAKKFNKKTGFWRKGKGCIIDRHMRSNTCIAFVCDVGPNNLKDELNSLKGTIRDYENHILRKVRDIKKGTKNGN